VAVVVFFLLLGVWMKELALVGLRWAAMVGALSLFAAAWTLAAARDLRARPNAAAAHAALGRVVRTRAQHRPLIRVVP